MFCPNCGTKNEDEALFCGNCGTRLVIDVPQETPVQESVEEVRSSLLAALIDRKINKYITSMGGLVKKLEKDKYLLVINRKSLDTMEEDRFSVLEDVKTVNIGNSIAVTVSIGIGMNCGGYAQNYEADSVSI